MTDLKKYRLENLDWIDQFLTKLGADAFIDFENRVYNALNKLQVNRYYNIAESILPDQQELFIKFCCCYIDKHPEYEFNDDYTQIWRKETYEQWKMEIRRRNLHSRKCWKTNPTTDGR